MRLVVADTSPIFYLFSIDLIDVLPQLFGKILVPDAVYNELCHPAVPPAVREWAVSCPDWLEVKEISASSDAVLQSPDLQSLDDGERSAIALAELLKASLILIDERKGTSVALSRGFEVTGTLGVLDLAARRGLINLADAFERLRATNFRYPPEIMNAMLRQKKKQ